MKGNLLIISNAAMSQSDSNGRTLARLLDCIPKEQKHQFFVYGIPDFGEGETFYNVSDIDALNSFLRRKTKNGFQKKCQTGVIKNFGCRNRSKKKTPFKMLIREFVWKFGSWQNKYLKDWINKVNPTAILVVAADNNFTLNYAKKIAKKRRIPILLYTTEEYPLKNYNYLTKKRSFFYFIMHLKLNHSYFKIKKYVSAAIFNSEPLAIAYKEKYNYPCHTIYPTSDIDWVDNHKIQNLVRISYLGNLGLNRYRALIDIAELIGKVKPDVKVDIYGKPSDEVKQELEKCRFINLKDFISYEKVVNVIHKSTLLLHVEYKDNFYTRDLRYAFSTKITDSICSGTPLLVYAPNELVETQFLRKNDCAFVASNEKELKEQLLLAITNEEERKNKLTNAKYVRENYFTNKGQFVQILEKVVSENTSS